VCHVMTCRDVTSGAHRDERVQLVVRVAPWLFLHDGRRKSSSVRVYKFNVLCSGFASIYQSQKHADVATPLSTCRASRDCCTRRDERVVLRRAVRQTQHSTSRLFFFLCQMHALDSVSCRVLTCRNKWNLGFTKLTMMTLNRKHALARFSV